MGLQRSEPTCQSCEAGFVSAVACIALQTCLVYFLSPYWLFSVPLSRESAQLVVVSFASGSILPFRAISPSQSVVC